MQKEYPISDLARIFPDMPPEDFARLVASIREDRLMDPIARSRATAPAPWARVPESVACAHRRHPFPAVPGTGLYPSFPTPHPVLNADAHFTFALV